MIQGGDPTGTGRGGDSCYGGPFADEISRNLKHTGAGVVSMANSGPNTNKSQFFVSLKPLPSLDGKHTIFGRIYSGTFSFSVTVRSLRTTTNFIYFPVSMIIGMAVIHRMGMVGTDKQDRPKSPITIHKATPFVGPPPPLEEQQNQQQNAHRQLAATAAS